MPSSTNVRVWANSDDEFGTYVVLALEGYSLLEVSEGTLSPAVGVSPAFALKLAEAIVEKAGEALRLSEAQFKAQAQGEEED